MTYEERVRSKKIKLKANPYVGKLKKSITIRLDTDVIDYFKELAEQADVPYQTLVKEYLKNYLKQSGNRRLEP